MGKDNSNFFDKKSLWAEVKDTLLGVYLTVYFQKLLSSRKHIVYIDCFAGKGRFKSGEDGSPRVALKVRDKCLNGAHSSSSTIYSFFLDDSDIAELSNNVSEFNTKSRQVQVAQGKFEETVCNFLTTLPPNINVFLYIDPYGIKSLKFKIFEDFSRFGFHSFEMLINFNSFGLFRNACAVKSVSCSGDDALAESEEMREQSPSNFTSDDKSEALLNKITGGDYWKNIVERYKNKEINGYQAEQILSNEYKKMLLTKYKYVLDIPIRLKDGHRPKYRMIHVTNHEDGCFKMAENMLNRASELYMKASRGQTSLFDFGVEDKEETEIPVDSALLKCISNYNNYARITELIARFYTEYGIICKVKEINDLLREWEKNGKVEILRLPEKTLNGQASKFMSESTKHKVLIRMKK